SYVSPDPLYLEFEYVQRIAQVLDQAAPEGERLRVVHVGGAGMTLARYVAATRPTSAQIVLEPDAALTEEVRAAIPLPRNSGVKVRAQDGRTGLAAMPDDYADVIIIDAFAGAQVPGELATLECFRQAARVLVPGGTLAMNMTDSAPFAWSRRTLAGIAAVFGKAGVMAEPTTLKGRRFGNLVAAAGSRVDFARLERGCALSVFPFRLLRGSALERWIGAAAPFTDADTGPSPDPADLGVRLV
ncbi:MAG: fused MFS/spermidine synthase, partial [Propionibacteriaceae bacterium]|nr:fused MFS/spermidine synthase [Propionibacteriaceae bacterium]